MNASTSELVEVPVADAAGVCQWIYQAPERVQILGDRHQRLMLPQPVLLVQLLAQAYESGCRWALIDGPRRSRPAWLINPWWGERPEMSQRLIELTQATCVRLGDLSAAAQQIAAR